VRYSVLHRGIRIGAAELPDGRQWMGGFLECAPGYEDVRAILEAVVTSASAGAAARLLQLPLGGEITGREFGPYAIAVLQRAAALEFELQDEAGLRVRAAIVRIADLLDGKGPRVRVDLREDSAGVPSSPLPVRHTDRNHHEPGV
jgi:hypothetical protein